MVISKIIGGLGNQMFQYAAGYSLAKKINEEFKIDLRFFKNYNLHNGSELGSVFSISANNASTEDIKKVLGWRKSPIILNILEKKKCPLLNGSKCIMEYGFEYWPFIQRIKTDCYLTGYWQSDKYFNDYSSEIRKQFVFKKPIDAINSEIASAISSCNSVSLHVRRGDYANNQKTLEIHGLCSVDFYKEAIAYIDKTVSNPIYYIFSDDIEWAKNNIKISSLCHYINHNNGKESYNDMRLISLCKSHIISNSTFSWWGAWLSVSNNKIVIMPKQWFADKSIITRDIVPHSWITI